LTFQSRKLVLSTFSLALQTPTLNGCLGKNPLASPWSALCASAVGLVAVAVSPVQLQLREGVVVAAEVAASQQ
jgi:hypothetical protein